MMLTVKVSQLVKKYIIILQERCKTVYESSSRFYFYQFKLKAIAKHNETTVYFKELGCCKCVFFLINVPN